MKTRPLMIMTYRQRREQSPCVLCTQSNKGEWKQWWCHAACWIDQHQHSSLPPAFPSKVLNTHPITYSKDLDDNSSSILAQGEFVFPITRHSFSSSYTLYFTHSLKPPQVLSVHCLTLYSGQLDTFFFIGIFNLDQCIGTISFEQQINTSSTTNIIESQLCRSKLWWDRPGTSSCGFCDSYNSLWPSPSLVYMEPMCLAPINTTKVKMVDGCTL